MIAGKPINRISIIVSLFAIAVVLILIRYMSLMLFAADLDFPSKMNRIERGPILDRNGKIMAIQSNLDSVTVWIPDLESREETAELLSSALTLNVSSIRNIFDERTGFAYIKRHVTPTESDVIRELIESKSIMGVQLEEESVRTYPGERIGAQIIGFVDTDNRGIEGIELALDSELSSTASPSTGFPQYGNQVVLTIDQNLQYKAEQLADRAYAEHAADSVMILAMDANDGDILAMASAPSFNPNTFSSYPIENRINRPAVVAYEPGSVFKIFSVASVIELGVDPNQTFYCNGYYLNPAITEPIKCLSVHGTIGFTQIIKYSCNSGAAYASDLVSENSFYEKLEQFGFGEQTALSLPGESNGILKSTRQWSARTKPTMSFGQEISTSAVQVVAAATVFANNGDRIEPHIVRRILGADGSDIYRAKRTFIASVLSSDTARSVLSMMEQATWPGGTATRARIEGIRVSAKSGTAQAYDVETGTYSEEDFTASTLAIFPTNDPKLIVYVVIRHPKAGEIYGGRIAAPIVGEFGEEIVSYLNLGRTFDTVLSHPGIVTFPAQQDINLGATMPDLTGFSKRELLPLFQIEEISVSFHGEGWVVSQSPLPGAPVGIEITIEFSDGFE